MRGKNSMPYEKWTRFAMCTIQLETQGSVPPLVCFRTNRNPGGFSPMHARGLPELALQIYLEVGTYPHQLCCYWANCACITADAIFLYFHKQQRVKPWDSKNDPGQNIARLKSGRLLCDAVECDGCFARQQQNIVWYQYQHYMFTKLCRKKQQWHKHKTQTVPQPKGLALLFHLLQSQHKLSPLMKMSVALKPLIVQDSG